MKSIRLCGGPFADRTIEIGDGLTFVVVRDAAPKRAAMREATYVPSQPLQYGADRVELWRYSDKHATYERSQ